MNKYEWLSHLVAFDTTSRLSNLELIHYVQRYLEGWGIQSFLTPHASQPKANLFAIIPAQDGNQQGGLVLSGHTDVVPVEGQAWDTNPFSMTKRDDKIFGRGTSDMKGFIAVVLSLVPHFLQLKLSKPLYFAFSFDEEIGCLGAPLMIDDIKNKNIQPAACLVGEPTEMRPVVAHKGKQTFRCHVKGAATHSSLTPEGCNAIEYAARLICFVRDMADHYQKNGLSDPHFDVPFTTFTTNLIQGGNSQNTIPAECEFVFEFRHLPEDDANQINKKIKDYIDSELLPKMRQEFSSATIVLENLGGADAFTLSEEEDITRLVRKLTKVDDLVKVSYGTEAGLFKKASIPTIICGPGSIEQAHRANEFVTLQQLEKCEAFLKDFVAEFCLV